MSLRIAKAVARLFRRKPPATPIATAPPEPEPEWKKRMRYIEELCARHKEANQIAGGGRPITVEPEERERYAN